MIATSFLAGVASGSLATLAVLTFGGVAVWRAWRWAVRRFVLGDPA